jgi:hypothetical protein
MGIYQEAQTARPKETEGNRGGCQAKACVWEGQTGYVPDDQSHQQTPEQVRQILLT